MADKKTTRDETTTPIPIPSSASSRRSVTPIKSPSPSFIKSPSPSLASIENEDDCGHHKRCSCFRRPRPPPQSESLSPRYPGLLKKKVSTSSMASRSSNHSYPSLPSTPDKSRYGKGKAHNFDDSFPTTPAGPPPSSGASMTPAGPPPPYLGSSMIPQPQFRSSRTEGSGEPLHFGTPVGQTPQLPKLLRGSPAYIKQVHGIFSSPSAKRYNQQQVETARRNTARLSKNTPALQPNDFFKQPAQRDEDEMDGGDEVYDLHDGEDSQALSEDQDEGMDESVVDGLRQSVMARESLMVEGEYDEPDVFTELAELEGEVKRSVPVYDDDNDSDLLLPTPGRAGAGTNESGGFRDTMRDTDKDLEYLAIARDIYKAAPDTNLHESDELLLRTEQILKKVYDEGLREDESDEALDRAISASTAELIALWDHYDQVTAPSNTDAWDLGIGPDPSHSPFANANFLASLLLQLHQSALPFQKALTFSRMSYRSSTQFQTTQTNKPMPATLLDWINRQHNPIPDMLKDLSRYPLAPSASRTFWKEIHSGLLRGQVAEVVKILKDAGWKYARENGRDRLAGNTGTGLDDQALANTEKVVSELIGVLEEHCPAFQGDWNNQSSNWKMFRLKVDDALRKLNEFAEGRNRSYESEANDPSSFALQSRKAESKVPWPILQNLKVLYAIVSGDSKSIIDASADWCEATVGLMSWWDESKERNRVVLGESHFAGDGGDPAYYLRKLKRSVKRATRSGLSPLNIANPIEIGLVCVFRGDVEAAIGMIRIWSLPLAAAVAEIAALGRWLPRTEPRSLLTMELLDMQDLELLGLTGPNDRNDGIKDNTLNMYASALAKDDRLLESKDAPDIEPRESWELALAILGRLDDPTRSEESVGLLLDIIPIDNTKTLEKLLLLLNRLCLTHHAEKQAEKWADTVADTTQDFGEALRYYALAHKPKKVKDVLNLLTSYCLVESRSFPMFDDLDPFLKRLISDKKAALEELEQIDSEASQLIQRYLGGYAVLRQYFDARDEQVLAATEPKKNAKWQGLRNKSALQRLVLLINSAADNIRGGLYDESCDSVVSVEFLLVLLGEALPFISQPGTESIITIQHLEVLFRAIEDLQTVSSRVYSACDQFFMTVLASARGLKGSTPSDLLAQSTASGLGQSQFSLVGSTVAASQYRKSMSNSGVIVSKGDVKRAWDWRRGLSSKTKSEVLLGILRLGLANHSARCLLEEADASF